MNEDFYKKLPEIHQFQEIFNDKFYREVPESWWIVVTDVVGSTKAIEAGKYKDVNIAGGLSAMAMSNYNKDMELPFIFGGDGITFLIPQSYLDDTKSILADTRKKVKEYYSLDLRVGMVPVELIKSSGHNVFLAKHKVSQFYKQAVIKGSGIDYAEYLVKQPDSKYIIPEDQKVLIEADFKGFTCRWDDIPSTKGETISIIIKFLDSEEPSMNYSDVFQKIESILGKESDYHPLKEDALNISQKPSVLSNEALVSANGSGLFKYLYLSMIYIQTWMTKLAILFQWNIRAFFYNLKDMKAYQIASADYRKFDGNLKMVVSLSTEKRKELTELLDRLEKHKVLLYGIHISNRALITCLMHASSSTDVHFIDAADGGYAMAAKILKKKLL